MKAVLLCGGEGVRLRPLTCDTPKPMLPLLGRPLLEYTLRHLKTHGVDHAALTLGYLPERVMPIAQIADEDLKLDFFTEDVPLGTAGAVAHAAKSFKRAFFVVSGDALTDIDLSAAFSFHKSTDALCTCILHREAEPSRFGVAVTEENGRIVKFQEKPQLREAESFSVNTGIYILEPEVLSRIPEGRAYDFAKDLFPELVEEGRLYGFKASGYWSDIGSPRAYLQAQEDLMEDRVLFAFAEGKIARKTVAETAEVDPSALLIPPVYIGENCRIGKGCVIGPGTVVEDGCVIGDRTGAKMSLIGKNSYLARNVQIRRTIVCAGAQLMEDSRAFEGSILGKGVKLGRMATVSAQVKIWPEKTIPDRARVGHDVVFGSIGEDLIPDNGTVTGVYGRDLSVSALSRTAMAIAKALPRGSRIALAAAGDEVSQSVQKIVTGAINEQMAHLVQLGDLPLAVLRDAVPRMKLAAGICISAAGRQLTLQLVDEAGFDPDPKFVRRIREMLERMGEEVCTGAIGKSQTVAGARQVYLRACRKMVSHRQTVPIRVESTQTIAPDILQALRLAQTHLTSEALFTLVIKDEGWTMLDEKGTELTDTQKRSALWQAALETGRIKGEWPIQADCRIMGLMDPGSVPGVRLLRVSSRPDLWMRAMSRMGHSAQVEDAGFFLDPYQAASLVGSALFCKGVPFSQWLRRNDSVLDISEHYEPERAWSVMEHIHSLRAEAAEMFDGGMRMQQDGDVFVEWGGENCRIRIHASAQNEAQLRLLLESILE